MVTPSCVRLSTLTSILREEYRRRSAISAENADPKEVVEAEAGIRRAHELLTTHRQDCPMCSAYQREASLQSGARKSVNSEHEVFRLDRVS
jgi:hypothetical protein